MNSYDAIVVGAGAGGGVTACVLAEAGFSVLLLERGRNLNTGDIPRDHVRNHRLARHGHNVGPELSGHPRVHVDAQGEAIEIPPHDGRYHNNAMGVGGGTRVFGAQAWRFLPQDFRMASIYGIPDGSSLADWPISYEELAPYYDRAEWEIGVCGEGDGNVQQGARTRGYPMPPVRPNRQTEVLSRGAKALGWATFPVPMLINTIPRDGREACVQCQHCVGFACVSDSKNGTHNTVIPRALATGTCTLVTGAIAGRVDTDEHGNVIGVSYIAESGSGLSRVSAVARVVIIACGAIESARLLLNSQSSHHPRGLGNEFGQVGRNLQGHVYAGCYGRFENEVYDGVGPGVSIATCEFNHGNAGIVGGGMLADEFVKLPIIFWYRALPPNLSRWGLENKRWMRQNFRRVMQVCGPVQEIPNPESRVTLDPSVRDRYDIPVARLSGTIHRETARTVEFMRERAEAWMKTSGAVETWSSPNPVSQTLSAGQHQAGTCRMGDDPRSSVTDAFCRAHGHDNLYIADGSIHVTNGGFNPVLTIMALAFRTAEKILDNLS